MVSSPDGDRQGHAQDDDRRARAKVADCFVALRDDGHGTGWGCPAPRRLSAGVLDPNRLKSFGAPGHTVRRSSSEVVPPVYAHGPYADLENGYTAPELRRRCA